MVYILEETSKDLPGNLTVVEGRMGGHAAMKRGRETKKDPVFIQTTLNFTPEPCGPKKQQWVRNPPNTLCPRKRPTTAKYPSPHSLDKTHEDPLFTYDKARQRLSKPLIFVSCMSS